jgi:hypothetical protein
MQGLVIDEKPWIQVDGLTKQPQRRQPTNEQQQFEPGVHVYQHLHLSFNSACQLLSSNSQPRVIRITGNTSGSSSTQRMDFRSEVIGRAAA